MYRCPRDHGHDEFTAEAVAPVRQTIAADGAVIAKDYAPTERTGPVRCGVCEARAEWIDARQTELFAVAPDLFATL